MGTTLTDRKQQESIDSESEIDDTFQEANTRIGTRLRIERIKCSFPILSNFQKILIAILVTAAAMCIALLVSELGEGSQYMDQPFVSLEDCTQNPCLHDGECIAKEGKQSCKCRAEFAGSNCQVKNECIYHGTCTKVKVSDNALCECRRDGYVRDPHNSTKCTLENDNATLIFTSSVGIEQFSLKEKSTTTLLNHARMSSGLDFLHRTRTVFWTSTGDGYSIYKAQLGDRQDKTLILTDSGPRLLSLAVDWIYNRIYYSVAFTHIYAANVDGTMKNIIIKDDIAYPTSVVLNPLNGWMYWADYSSHRLERAGMDGSHREVIAIVKDNSPWGLTLDLIENRLYWTTTSHPCSIYSMNTDGSDQKLVFRAALPTFSASHFWSITTFGDKMYWKDAETRAVYQANKCNGQDVTKLHSFINWSHSYWSVKAYHYSLQPEGHNYCADRIDQCSHLCFPTPSTGNESISTKCACPDGLKLSYDQLNCA